MKRKAALAITFSLIFALSAAIGFGGCARETEDIFSRPVVEKKEGEKKDWNDVSSYI